MVHLTAVLVSLVATGASVAADNPAACIALHCPLQSARCVLDPACLATLQCMVGCDGKPDQAQCQFECEMTTGNGNEAFISLLQCMAEHGCLPDLPPDGECLAGPADCLQVGTHLHTDPFSADNLECLPELLWTGRPLCRRWPGWRRWKGTGGW